MDFRDKKPNEDIKMVNLHSGHRKRLRTSLNDKGWENVEEYKMLEYILSCVVPRKDTNPLAHTLINTFGNIVCSLPVG